MGLVEVGKGQLHSCSSRLGGMACPLPVSSTEGGEGWWLLSSVPLRFILHKELLWGSGVLPQQVPTRALDPASTAPGEICFFGCILQVIEEFPVWPQFGCL